MHVNRVRCTPISTSLNGNLCLEFVRIRERFRRFYRFLCTKCTVKAISDKSNSQDLLSDIRLLRLTWSFLFLTIFLCNLFSFFELKIPPISGIELFCFSSDIHRVMAVWLSSNPSRVVIACVSTNISRDIFGLIDDALPCTRLLEYAILSSIYYLRYSITTCN